MELISDQYREQQRKLLESPDYQSEAIKIFASTIIELVHNNQFETILDYGSGNATLPTQLQADHEVNIRCYDPSLPRFSRLPEPAELVVCLDVLEQVEPEYIDAVLDHIAAMTEKLALVTFRASASDQVLSDGRNANLIQESSSWWLPKLVDRFDLDHLLKLDNQRYLVLLLPKTNDVTH